jgi:hypothetical protein
MTEMLSIVERGARVVGAIGALAGLAQIVATFRLGVRSWGARKRLLFLTGLRRFHLRACLVVLPRASARRPDVRFQLRHYPESR